MSARKYFGVFFLSLLFFNLIGLTTDDPAGRCSSVILVTLELLLSLLVLKDGNFEVLFEDGHLVKDLVLQLVVLF